MAQVAQLAATVRPKYRAMVLAQAGLGLRIGEVLALLVQDVDFPRRAVRVEHQIDTTRRRIPRRRRSRGAPFRCPRWCRKRWPATSRSTRPRPTACCSTATGMPYWHEYYTQKVFKPTVIRAGLPSATSTHDLRHHFASALLARGESAVAVAERLGHEDGALVPSTYGHLMADAEDRTRRAVEGAWESASVPLGEDPTAQGRPR